MDGVPLTAPIPTNGPSVHALAAQTRSADQAALEQAGRGFESLFLSMLVKEMRQTLEPGVLFGNDNSDVYGGMFDHYMAQHLAQGGNLGIADLVARQVNGPDQS